MMAVPVSLRPTFQDEEPKTLFQTRVPILANAYRWHYDVSPDGESFLVNTAPASVRTPAIHVVLDWRARVPPSTPGLSPVPICTVSQIGAQASDSLAESSPEPKTLFNQAKASHDVPSPPTPRGFT